MNEHRVARLGRLAPLAGAAYALLTIVGDLTIGKFPDSGTPVSDLAAFYGAHHARVSGGGMVLAWASVFLAVFGCALWSRARAAGAFPAVAAAVLVGTGVAVAADLAAASVYWSLGHLSTEGGVTPAALQAWHIAGSEGGLGGGVAILLFSVAATGFVSRSVPRWLAWPALALGLLQISPIGFAASMLFLLWMLVASVYMTARPLPALPGPGQGDAPSRHSDGIPASRSVEAASS
jgi:hypothetical protein